MRANINKSSKLLRNEKTDERYHISFWYFFVNISKNMDCPAFLSLDSFSVRQNTQIKLKMYTKFAAESLGATLDSEMIGVCQDYRLVWTYCLDFKLNKVYHITKIVSSKMYRLT